MSGFDVDKIIEESRKRDDLFGIKKDNKKGYYIRLPSIKSIEGELSALEWLKQCKEERKKEKEKVRKPSIEINYYSSKINGINVCKWELKIINDLDWKLLTEIKKNLDENIKLDETDRISLDLIEEKKDLKLISLMINGQKDNNMCIWCKSFWNSIENIALDESFDIKNVNNCISRD